MGGMAAVAPLLDDMTALAESASDFLRDAEKLPLGSHAVPTDRVAAFLKVFQGFGMAFPAFFRKDHGLLFSGRLVIGMAGHAVNAPRCMLGFNPGLEETGGHALVAFHAKSGVHVGCFIPGAHAGQAGGQKDRAEKNKAENLEEYFHFLNLSSPAPLRAGG